MATTTTETNGALLTNGVARLQLFSTGDPAPSSDAVGSKTKEQLFEEYYPIWEKEKFPPVERVPFTDAGSRGTPDKRNLFLPGTKRRQVTPIFGEEIWGVQLSQLSKAGLDDLALLAAERGFLVFRDQDFKDIGPERQIEIARHFGPIHRIPVAGHPAGYPEMYSVLRDSTDPNVARYVKPPPVPKLSSVNWHMDHTAELQPPGMTFFFGVDTPEAGGDTLFLSATEAYRRLSEPFKKAIDHLNVVHNNEAQYIVSKSIDGPQRFDPLTNTIHPLVVTHPVTREKILYFHEGHVSRIDGLKKEESDYLLKFLDDYIVRSAELQARARYEPGTVVVWDNRVVVHSANPDESGHARRLVVRISTHAGTPEHEIQD